MITALQEREHKFLEMIEEMILSEFGEDNHLYPAFELAFEVAAYNIQNDVKLTLGEYIKKEYLAEKMKSGGKM